MSGCNPHLPDGLAGCFACRQVWRDYDRRRRARIASGSWLPKVDPAVALEHVGRLRDAGLTFQDIADATGVDRATLLRLRRRAWITGGTERDILAVAVPEPPDPAADVDEVAVERVLAGECLELNDAELVATLQACVGRRQPLMPLALRLGLNYAVAKRLSEGELPPRMAKRAALRVAS